MRLLFTHAGPKPSLPYTPHSALSSLKIYIKSGDLTLSGAESHTTHNSVREDQSRPQPDGALAGSYIGFLPP